jgi:hypothetical protein
LIEPYLRRSFISILTKTAPQVSFSGVRPG